MKRLIKLMPTILMMVLCVGVLAVGVFALTPSVNIISGNLTVGSSAYEIGIEAYKYNADGTMQSTPFYSASSVRAGVDIPLTGLGFSMTNINEIEELADLDIKITFKITNKAGVALGAYFSTTPMAAAATLGDVKKERELTTNMGLNDVVKATMTGYKELAISGTIDMDLTFSMLRFINGDDQTVNPSQDINRIYLNVETFNEELVEGSDAYYEALGYIFVGESEVELTRAKVTEDINAGTAAGKDGTKIKIANGVPSIANASNVYSGAFFNKTLIIDVVIPSSVTSIGSYAFRSCSGLIRIEIPNSVTNIGRNAFESCNSLTNIEIPNSVTSIGDDAFYSCDKLTSIEIPSSVTSIGKSIFRSCGGLENITVDKENTIYTSANGANAIIEILTNTLIVGCKNTKIPNSVTSIGKYAFSGYSGLTSITISNSVTSIGEYAFDGCSGLTSITIPKGVTSISDKTFKNCTSLISIEFPSSVTSIGSSAFDGCRGLTSITIPNSVTSIGDNAFKSCTSLTSIEIPDSVTSISFNAFYSCSGLTSITISDNVTSIASQVFYGCSGLTSITIPEGVTSIGNSAFSGCSGLTSITIPEGVTSIGNSAFSGCSGLKRIIVEKGTATTFNCKLPYAYTLNGTTACTTSTYISRSATENNVYSR